MKEKLKNIAKDLLLFAKKNYISCICLLLAGLVVFTGTLSFAKYVSVDSISKRPGAATINGSADITGVSALSFTNTNFWGGDDNNAIAMNSLRSIDILVNNFDYDEQGNKKVTDVRMEYDIVFLSPVSFTENLAFQLLAMDGHPVTTQMNMGHFIKAAHNQENHESLGKAQYNGVDVDHNHIFTFESNADESVIICTTEYNLPGGGHAPLTIRIERVTQMVEQTLMFRAWDTTKYHSGNIDTEGGDLLPPIRMTIETPVEMYRISIHLPLFVMEPGAESTHKYRMTIAPTQALHDDHLGAFIQVAGGKDGDNTIYISPETLRDEETVYFSSIRETVYESDTNLGINADWGTAKGTYHVPTIKTYYVGEVIEDEETKSSVYFNDLEHVTNITLPDDIKPVGGTTTGTVYPIDNAITGDDDNEYTLYFIRSNWGGVYTHQSNYNNQDLTAQQAYNISRNQNTYKLEIEEITQTVTTTYASSAIGDQITGGIRDVTKTVVAVDGSTYVIKKTTTDTENTIKYTNLTVEKTVTYTYTVKTYKIYKVTRNGNNYSWTLQQGADISDYSGMNATSVDLINEKHVTSSVISENIPDITTTYNGASSSTSTYQKYVRERLSDEKNNAVIKDLSQMIYNPDGTTGIIYYDGADPSKDVIIETTDENGAPITIIKEQHKDYLEFYDTVNGDKIQVLYLSPCYSKDYFFSVKVVFRQIQ